MTARFQLQDIDEHYAPPERPMLDVSVITCRESAADALISIRIVEPREVPPYKELAQIVVPMGEFVKGVEMLMTQQFLNQHRRHTPSSDPVDPKGGDVS